MSSFWKKFMSQFRSTGSGTVNINGRVFSGDVCVYNGQVFVNGQAQDVEKVTEFNVTINGEVDSLNLASGNVTINGNVDSVRTVSGDVRCDDVAGDVKTTSGDIHCDKIAGSVSSVSGDFYRG